MYAFGIGNRRFRRSVLGYRRRDVEEALDASARALAEAQATAESRERKLAARERELGWQRKQIDELDQVSTLLAKRVVEHRREAEALREELRRQRDATDPDGRGDLRLAGPEPDREGGELVGEGGDGVLGSSGKLHRREAVERLLEEDSKLEAG
jgi:cell division septum initiation protein DivIVA